MQSLLRSVVLLLAIVPFACAQAFSVKGIVTDSIGEPESFATIRIYTSTDTVKPLVLGTSNLDGVFDLKLPKAGGYRLDITSVGKSPLAVEFESSAARPDVDLGHLTLKTASTALGEIVVVANKPLISKEIDRIGYDVQADEDSKTIQLDEMLKRVPMVSVDPDGTIRVKGSTSFKVYKNGRPNNSFSRNAKEIFKAIPASMIKKIEVITDPGSREDAEGTTAILNIVTMEETVIKGVMGNAGIDYSNLSDLPSANLWLSTQVNKVTMSGYGGYNHFSGRQTKSATEVVTTYTDSGNTLKNAGQSRSKGNVTWFGVEGSWEPDTLNLLTIDFNGYSYNMNPHTDNLIEMTGADGSRLYGYRESYLGGSKNDYFDLGGSVNYQHSTRRKGETLTLSYMLSTTSQGQDSYTRYSDMVNMPVNYTGIDNCFRLNFIEHTGQFDWERPLMEHHTLNLGAKYIYRQNHSKTTIDYLDANSTYSNFIHRTQVAAAYADYRINLGRWGLRAGVRYEYSRLSARYKDGSQEPFGSNLNDVVPNGSVMFNLNDANTFKLSYSSRINRPGIDYLNPAVTVSPTSVSKGNPDLGSTRNQDLSLNYSYMGRKFMVDFTASYQFSNNAIISVKDIRNDITYSGYANAGHNRTVYMSLYGRWTINTKANISINCNVSHDDYRNDNLGISAKGWTGWLWLRYSQSLPWNLRLSAGAFSWLGSTDLYSTFRPVDGSWLNHQLSLQRSFLKEDRLTVRLNAHNPFGPGKRRFKSEPLNMAQTGYGLQTQLNNRLVYISVSYRFGSLNAQVKKVNRGISNDDLQGRKAE